MSRLMVVVVIAFDLAAVASLLIFGAAIFMEWQRHRDDDRRP